MLVQRLFNDASVTSVLLRCAAGACLRVCAGWGAGASRVHVVLCAGSLLDGVCAGGGFAYGLCFPDFIRKEVLNSRGKTGLMLRGRELKGGIPYAEGTQADGPGEGHQRPGVLRGRYESLQRMSDVRRVFRVAERCDVCGF